MTYPLKAILLTSALAISCGPAFAQSQGDWTLGIGYATIVPKSDNGTLAPPPNNNTRAVSVPLELDVHSDESFIFTAEYFFWDNIGLELLVATPFEHDFDLGDNITGSTKHLPPTLSLNYHFPTQSAWKPYVGAGINYTRFSSEKLSNGFDLQLESSWGISVQAGVDYQISENGFVRTNVRWFDIDSDAKVNGENWGTAKIDPLLFGISYVHKF